VSEHGPIAQEADFEEILARLHAEVERGDCDPPEGAGDTFSLRRGEAERLWAVSAERPFLYRPGAWGRARGLLLVPAKAFLRKLMRWYVEPLAYEQRRFNAAALEVVDALSERQQATLAAHSERTDAAFASHSEHTDAAFAALYSEVFALSERADGEFAARDRRLDDLKGQVRRTGELEERLTRLERRERSSARQLPQAPQAEMHVEGRGQLVFPDYFAFESRMRGATEVVQEKQRRYVEDFRGAEPVLDLGCGRGEFLSLLREAGIEAKGVDVDADMVAYARGEGLEVEHTGAVEYLEGLEDGFLGGIFAAQLLEHLPAAMVVRLLELAAAKLRPRGLLVAETINPVSPIALRNYFADLTHAQLLVPETLELLARQAGFASVAIRFLNEPEEKLAEPADPTIAANVRRLNDLLFAPLDYAIVART
jgi:SAM-dependent methyltransferase